MVTIVDQSDTEKQVPVTKTGNLESRYGSIHLKKLKEKREIPIYRYEH